MVDLGTRSRGIGMGVKMRISLADIGMRVGTPPRNLSLARSRLHKTLRSVVNLAEAERGRERERCSEFGRKRMSWTS